MGFKVFKVFVYDEEGIMGGFACGLCMSRNQDNQSEGRWSIILRMLLLLCFQRSMLGLLMHEQEAGIVFLCKTGGALIDVYGGELTLRACNKSITFNLDQTLRYSANYDDMSVNRIDIIDVACEEYPQEILGFFVSGNPTPSTEPIVSTSSPTLTPFGDSNFILEETDAFLAIDDEPISLEIDDSYYDSEEDILLLEEFLNDDPSSPPLPP
nr:reverse transcriptase domain-containing protein [Tanacetum cinerariifolium]